MARTTRSHDDPDHPRHRLLAAAAAAFAQKGYDAATVDEIASAAGLTKTATYYYFRSKQALAAALFTRGLEALHATLDDVERRALPPAEALATVIAAHVLGGLQNPTVGQTVLRRLPRDLRDVQHLMAERLRYRQRIGAIVERGIRDGVFVPIEPWVAVEALIGMASSVVDRASPEWPLGAEELAQRYAYLAVHSLLTPRLSTDDGTGRLWTGDVVPLSGP